MAGYIFGEGTIGVYKYSVMRGRGKKRTGEKRECVFFRPLVKISAREDDAEMLRFLHEKLGGYLYERKKNYVKKGGYISNPSVQWTLSSIFGVRRVMEILEKSTLPSKKKLLISSTKEFLMLADGHRYSKEQKARILEIIEEQKNIRSFTSVQ